MLQIPNIWIIGGGQIYSQAFPLADYLFLTRIGRLDGDPVQCDIFLDLEKGKDFQRITAQDDLCNLVPFWGQYDGNLQEGPWTMEFQVWEKVIL